MIAHLHGLSTPCLVQISARPDAAASWGAAPSQSALGAPHALRAQATRGACARKDLWCVLNWSRPSFDSGETKTFQKIPYNHFCFDNLGTSNDLVFLVQVNNGFGTNSNHISIKKPPPNAGDGWPEFLFH